MPRATLGRSGSLDRRWEVTPLVGAITVPGRDCMTRVLRMLPYRAAAVERPSTLVATKVVTHMSLRLMYRELPAYHYTEANFAPDVHIAHGP